ncbi:hypothetical protein ACZ91_07535 [Streptomyces regensis]|nr:hypothetical protein ACZ91_07535 [Streptomyces regensis]KOG73832.1 hypothetical protein ADK77_07795 [Streptomyces antibioticus]MBG7700370.1 hypothetical protein [Streptomyces sp. MC1]
MATRLLEQRESLQCDEDADYWLEEIEAVLPHCQTPLQMMSLNRYLDAALRALLKLEKRTGRSPALTEDARLALAAAVELQKVPRASHEADSPGAVAHGA